MRFPTSPDEFYRLRDDRTNRIVSNASYQSTHCVVSAEPSVSYSLTGQVMLLATCNLLSRWCRYVTLAIADQSVPVHERLGSGRLGEVILDLMHDADPFGVFRGSEQTNHPRALFLHVGSHADTTDAPLTVINASGWLAAITSAGGVTLPAGDDGNVVGGLGAACLGVAQVFKRAVAVPEGRLIQDFIFDLFQLKHVAPEQVSDSGPEISRGHLGRILMVGAGSVGSSTAYCLGLTGSSCDVTAIDHDIVKIENFNRSPIFGKHNFAINKARAVAEWLCGPSRRVHFFDGRWNDYITLSGGKPHEFDIWLPLANENGVRRSMQSNYPPLMIYGTTAASWGVNHARHIPGVDDCIVDRFPHEVQKDVLECATGEISTQEEGIDAALPFLSLFAGLLITADLLRIQLSGYPQVPNFAFFDFGGGLENIQAWNKSPRSNCSCKSLSKAIYSSLNDCTKFAHLAFAPTPGD